MNISILKTLASSESETMSEVQQVITEAAQADDVKERVDTLLSFLGEKLTDIGSNLIGGIVVAVIGWYIVKFLSKTIKKLFEKSKLDESITNFLMSLVNIGLKIVLFITVATTMGVEMTSFLTLLASAGLAISLALQGCLTNFAGGVLILLLKPFTVGDYIVDDSGDEGTVTSIDVIYTHLLTPDNRAVIIPNGNLANSTITNVTKEPIRRIDFKVSIDYNENVEKVRGILEQAARENPLVLQDRDIVAFVNKFDPSSIDMTLRIWVKSVDYWTLKPQLQEMIKVTFDKHNIVIPYDKLDVNIVNPDAVSRS